MAVERGFFFQITGSGFSEDDFSRLFTACFRRSKMFRQLILDTLWASGGFSGRCPDATFWVCEDQQQTPHKGGGRIDVTLRPGPGSHSRKYRAIHLENKKDARLTLQQLERYRAEGVEVLVAVTKNVPEVPQSKLDKLQVKLIRWQDICRALGKRQTAKPIDKFICDSFVAFLQDNDMAYRDAVTPERLDQFGKVLRAISTPDGSRVFSRNMQFGIGDECRDLLKDVWNSLEKRHPKLANWYLGGPGYSQLLNAERGIQYHYISLWFRPRRAKYKKHHIDCGFWFCQESSVGWYIEGVSKKHCLEWIDIRRLQRKGHEGIDANRLAARISKFLVKHGFV